MTQNLKLLAELANKDKAIEEKLSAITGEDRAATIEQTIKVAAEAGITLTDADFAEAEELCNEELAAVSGGRSCYCFLGGIGRCGDVDDDCACVAVGIGRGARDDERCFCAAYGQGDSRD